MNKHSTFIQKDTASESMYGVYARLSLHTTPVQAPPPPPPPWNKNRLLHPGLLVLLLLLALQHLLDDLALLL